MESNIITSDNQYSFIVWANALKPPSISPEAFETLLSLHLPDWIACSQVTWISAYTNLIDSAREHAELAKEIETRQGSKKAVAPAKTNTRPKDPEKKRELLASFFPK